MHDRQPYRDYRKDADVSYFRREMQRRRIIPLLGVFAASGFLAMEGVDQLIEYGYLPGIAYDIALVFYVFGFPGTLVIAWHHGEKGPQRPRPIEIWMHGFMLVGALGICYGIVRADDATRGLAERVSPNRLDPQTYNSFRQLAEEDRAAIVVALNGYVRSARAGDAKALASFVADDAVLIPPDGEAQVGRQAILESMAELPRVFDADRHFIPEDLSRIGNLAYAAGTITTDAKTHGIESMVPALIVLRRQPEGSWVMVLDICGRSPRETSSPRARLGDGLDEG